MSADEELRDALCAAAMKEWGRTRAFAEPLADVAVRRWRSYDRRNKGRRATPELRVRDLARGLRAHYPGGDLHAEPGEIDSLAEIFADVLTRRSAIGSG